MNIFLTALSVIVIVGLALFYWALYKAPMMDEYGHIIDENAYIEEQPKE